jgi:ATP-dependent DNA ligase
LRIRHQPLARKIEKRKAQWVKPAVLVDVEYRARMQASGLLRHPSFKGVREDLTDNA